MKTRLKKAKNKALLNKLAIASVGATALFLYTIGVTVKPGWLTYAVQFPALAIIAITALARVNDIVAERTSLEWQARRTFLSLAGTCAVAYGVAPFWGDVFPSWLSVAMTWGLAGSWLTTPGMPPWAKYIMGEAKLPKEMT